MLAARRAALNAQRQYDLLVQEVVAAVRRESPSRALAAVRRITMSRSAAMVVAIEREMGRSALSRKLISKYARWATDELEHIVRNGTRTGMDRKEIASTLHTYMTTGEKTTLAPTRVRGQAQQLAHRARRVAATEVNNHARGEKLQRDIARGFTSFRWTLAKDRGGWKRRKKGGGKVRSCLCDLYANADEYGLGKGVYPADDIPDFPHPYCKCTLVPVGKEAGLVDDKVIKRLEEEGVAVARSEIAKGSGTADLVLTKPGAGDGPLYSAAEDRARRERIHAEVSAARTAKVERSWQHDLAAETWAALGKKEREALLRGRIEFTVAPSRQYQALFHAESKRVEISSTYVKKWDKWFARELLSHEVGHAMDWSAHPKRGKDDFAGFWTESTAGAKFRRALDNDMARHDKGRWDAKYNDKGAGEYEQVIQAGYGYIQGNPLWYKEVFADLYAAQRHGVSIRSRWSPAEFRAMFPGAWKSLEPLFRKLK